VTPETSVAASGSVDAGAGATAEAARALRWLLVICAAAVLLRALHLWAMAGDPLFDHPVIDPRDNLERAQRMAAGHWVGDPGAYWKPPLYDYVLALHLRLFGASLWPIRVTQVGCDVLSCVLAFRLGRALRGAREGLWAAGVLALSGPLIYFTGEVTSASLTVTLELALLLLVLRARARPSLATWGVAGVMLGVSALLRAEALLLGGWMLAWLWWSLRERAPRQRLGWAAAALGAAACVIAPVTLRNWLHARDATLISANGGVNFYIGAEPRYHGVIGVRPGAEWLALMREPELAGLRKAGNQSRYFLTKGLRVMAADPAGAALHLVKKLGHFWHGRELPSNRDLYLSRARSPVLAALLWRTPVLCFPFGVLAALALAGAVLALRARERARFLLGPIAIHWVTVAAFFVTGRHRLLVVGPLAVLAALAAGGALERWRSGARRPVLWAAAATLAGALLLSAGPLLAAAPRAYAGELAAEEDHFTGTVLLVEQHQPVAAMAALERALARLPSRASTWFNLGQAAEAAGQRERALAAFARAVTVAEQAQGERYLVPQARERMHGLAAALASAPGADADAGAGAGAGAGAASRQLVDGVLCLDRGDWDCALRTLADQPALLAEALASRGHARLLARDDEAARADLARSAELRRLEPAAHLLYAIAAERLGRDDEATRALAAFRAVELPRGAFLRELGRPASAAERGLAGEAARAILRREPHDTAALRLQRLLGQEPPR